MGNAATAKKGNEIESGRANGEKIKYEGIMEFSKLRCEDAQDAMKPTEILHGEDVCLMGQQSSAGVTLASIL
ncbi:hypothetical protein DUI87_14782 [Hirundo rustica rustica]|uniref:Uncharacterized protein n=1 Tax=Hirundo rustica rustica TaxID=333673 RepID=A0A3M0K5T0_HIRRU|nr:hypothetical protein DUI87_14782 [Hirundo rustica rustica]